MTGSNESGFRYDERVVVINAPRHNVNFYDMTRDADLDDYPTEQRIGQS